MSSRTLVSTRNTLVPAGKLHHVVGAEVTLRDAADPAETWLDERPLAQHRADDHAPVALFEVYLRVRKQPELAAEPLRNGHLTL